MISPASLLWIVTISAVLLRLCYRGFLDETIVGPFDDVFFSSPPTAGGVAVANAFSAVRVPSRRRPRWNVREPHHHHHRRRRDRSHHHLDEVRRPRHHHAGEVRDVILYDDATTPCSSPQQQRRDTSARGGIACSEPTRSSSSSSSASDSLPSATPSASDEDDDDDDDAVIASSSSRRYYLSKRMAPAVATAVLTAAFTTLAPSSTPAEVDEERRSGFLFFDGTPPRANAAATTGGGGLQSLVQPRERRQLELCLVALLRVMYWLQSIQSDLQPQQIVAVVTTEDDVVDAEALLEKRKQRYLEAKLGAKAILTGKVGGGASGRVYTLGSLQLPSCLEDLEWHAGNAAAVAGGKKSSSSSPVFDLRRDFTESLASIVEFDGLDTLKDASPRSTLTLSQYNENKVAFIRRMISERILPTGRRLLDCFPSDAVERSQSYVKQYYPYEIVA